MMRRGLWHEPVLAAFVDDLRLAQDRAQAQPLPLLDLVLPRQGPGDTGTETEPPVTPDPTTPPATTTTTEPPITTPSSPVTPPGGDTSTSSSTSISTSTSESIPTTPSASETSTTSSPTGLSTPPPTGSSAPSRSTSTVFATNTSGDSSGGSGLGDDNTAKSSSGGFWSNKAAVGAVFGLVGLAGLVILFALITNAVRRSRARKYDRELSAAAASAPPAGGYRDDDGEQPTYPFQNQKEDYDMHEFNGSYGHPYAAAGASGAAMAGYHNYHNQGNEYQGQDYGSEYAPHMSSQYPYSESGSSSYPSTGPGGYYDPRQQGYPQHAQYPGPGPNGSPPPRDPFMSPPPRGMSPTSYNNGQVPPGAGYGAPPGAAGMAGMGAYGSTGFRGPEPQPPPSAYSGSERGAYAHMQRQDQLNRALSIRSAAPTYASHQPSDQGTSHGGHILASGGPPLGDQKIPLPPPPPEPSTQSHPSPPRPSGEHDAGNKSEGELPNPFRNRVSGEGESAEDWDDEESSGHGGQRVLKIANQ